MKVLIVYKRQQPFPCPHISHEYLKHVETTFICGLEYSYLHSSGAVQSATVAHAVGYCDELSQ